MDDKRKIDLLRGVLLRIRNEYMASSDITGKTQNEAEEALRLTQPETEPWYKQGKEAGSE